MSIAKFNSKKDKSNSDSNNELQNNNTIKEDQEDIIIKITKDNIKNKKIKPKLDINRDMFTKSYSSENKKNLDLSFGHESPQNETTQMETIYYQYKEIESDNMYELFDKGGQNKYIIPVWSPENDFARITGQRVKQPPIKHNTIFLKYLEGRFIMLLEYLQDTEIDNFLEFHYKEFAGEKHLFLINTDQLLKNDNLIEVKKRKIILHWIKEKEKKLNEPETKQNERKIKWTGTPSQFGYLFIELVNNGFIDMPLHNGEVNYTEFAKRCFEYFEIKGNKEKITTIGYLTNQLNPEKNSLSDTIRLKFTIPELKDLK
jgi:hypothetical protein